MQSKRSLRDFSLVIALVVICAFFAIVSPQFLSARNLSLLMAELSITATLAMGMLLVILPGHIDLSAGSGVGLIGGIAAVLVAGAEMPVHLLANLRGLLERSFGPAAAGWLPALPASAAGGMLCAFLVALLLWSIMG